MAGTDGFRWEQVNGEWQLVPEAAAVAVAEPPSAGIEADGRRECKTCGVVKPLTEFHLDPKGRLGRELRCGVCATQARKGYDRTRKERVYQAKRGNWAQSSDELLHQAAAAFRRWSECEDAEERAGARDAAIYRARQLLAAVED